MILASYNVENLFLRAEALDQKTWADGKDVLEKQRQINVLFQKQRYSPADKRRILELLQALGLLKADDGGKFTVLRRNKGKLLVRRKSGVEVVANGRGDWIGWIELKVRQVNEVATRATARVIRDVNADALAIVEAESRPSLLRFSRELIRGADGDGYKHIMLIDGNDERGIDVGLLTKKGYAISRIATHVDAEDKDGLVFSRDCAQYTVQTPKGNAVTVLVNHFKSKGYGSNTEARRVRQAKRVRKIYQALITTGEEFVAVVGDLNDTPDSPPLKVLRKAGLRDIGEHANFALDDPDRPGTFGTGTKSNKIDYILLSPALFERVQRGSIFRKGVWAGAHGDLFEHYPEITKAGRSGLRPPRHLGRDGRLAVTRAPGARISLAPDARSTTAPAPRPGRRSGSIRGARRRGAAGGAVLWASAARTTGSHRVFEDVLRFFAWPRRHP